MCAIYFTGRTGSKTNERIQALLRVDLWMEKDYKSEYVKEWSIIYYSIY